MPLTLPRLNAIFERARELKILIVGDLMLDEFIWGKVSRISPEAPIPVVEVQQATHYPGGAANVARNLCGIVERVAVSGLVGQDPPGQQLIALLRDARVGIDGIVTGIDRPTTRKTRVLARQQQVVRVDYESRKPLAEAERRRLVDWLTDHVGDFDAVILEDYGKGVLDQSVFDVLVKVAHERGVVVTVDPNPKNQLDWKGADLVKPNRLEALATAKWLAGRGLLGDWTPARVEEDSLENLKQIGVLLRKHWQTKCLVVTLGEDGMLLWDDANSGHHVPTLARTIYDVSGAGDTAIAFLTLALATGATGAEAVELANHAAGIVVGKVGTAAVTVEELRASLAG